MDHFDDRQQAQTAALAGVTTWEGGGPKPDFRSYMAQHVVIGDGAMATLLHQSGVPVRTCYEELNLSNPELIEEIHRAYLTAGATLLQTNTFSAHRAGLKRYGLENQLFEINRRAGQIALKAARGRAFVFGTIGSIKGLHPYVGDEGEFTASTLAAQFSEQARALLCEPLDGLLLETFADLEEMLIALKAIREVTQLPVIANLSPVAVGVTRDGVSIEEAFLKMREQGADVVGLNCRLGPAGILRTYEGVKLMQGQAYAAVPNAGLLHVVEGDYSYTGTTEYFADVAQRLSAQGVRLIGGCCGTTPEHVRKVTERLVQRTSMNDDGAVIGKPSAVEGMQPGSESGKAGTATGQPVVQRAGVDDAVGVASAAVRSQTAMFPQADLARGTVQKPNLVEQVKGQTTVIVELDPPRTLDVQKYMTGARALKAAGVDYVTLADNSLGHVRVSNMALAAMLKQEEIEPLVHVTCRDRNLIGQQSHLMGLHVLDIHHVLLVTGDPSKFGDLPGATSVYDTSSIELTKMVKRLNAGVAFSGQQLERPSRFVVGTSFNPHVLNFDKAIERLRRKVDAGADYVMTQPMFDANMFERIAMATSNLGVPVFAGVMPLVSNRNAQFLHNEVPGIQIPQAILERMGRTTKETGVEEGLRIAEELIDVALQFFNGIYLITPFLRYEITAALTEYIRSKDNENHGTHSA